MKFREIFPHSPIQYMNYTRITVILTLFQKRIEFESQNACLINVWGCVEILLKFSLNSVTLKNIYTFLRTSISVSENKNDTWWTKPSLLNKIQQKDPRVLIDCYDLMKTKCNSASSILPPSWITCLQCKTGHASWYTVGQKIYNHGCRLLSLGLQLAKPLSSVHRNLGLVKVKYPKWDFDCS